MSRDFLFNALRVLRRTIEGGCATFRGFIVLALILASTAALALDRNAFTFTHYDLKAQVVPAEQALQVSGRISLRNDSTVPQLALTLQISSTLAWQSIQLNGKPLAYVAEPYTTDIDHTGKVSEAIVNLPAAVPPKGTVELDVAYSGIVGRDSTRLARIGVPGEIATHSDWDQISDAFTAVRGVGYVCWYPVSLDALSLSEGNQLFQGLGEWKQRHAASSLHLALAVASDKLVVTNGRLLGQKARAEAEGTVQEREFEFAPMGLAPPTFVIAEYTLLSRPTINVFHLAGHQAAAQEFVVAAEKLQPFIADWFGPQRAKVGVIELPIGDVPFDSGFLLFTPLVAASRDTVETTIAHQLAHASIASPRPWISEGLAHFAQALVRERQDGRRAAITYMQQYRPALAEAEKQVVADANPAAQNSGEPLTRATDEIYYRSKAMFVWWMLRDMVGDQALQRAIRAYNAADDKEPSYVQRLIGAQGRKQLEWFFDDWVYRDRGLPDFRIDSASARTMLPENISVAITVENLGGAAAEVPVLVPQGGGDSREVLLVPAHGKAVTHVTVSSSPSTATVNDGSVPESDVSNNTFMLQ